MAKDFSPEERLLNLIRRKKKGPTPPERSESSTAPEEKPGQIKKPNVISYPLLEESKILRLENIKVLNTVLFSMFIAVILYFIVDIFLIPSREIRILEKSGPEKPSEMLEKFEAKPYSYYSKALGAKEVFKPLYIKEDPGTARPEVPIEELMGNLSLLGIVSGEKPQAIIEDKKQKKSFFLKEGQSAGGIFLKQIEAGAVTVVYKGEEFDLTM